MISKEIIRRVIEFDRPPRIGLNLKDKSFQDIYSTLGAKLINKKYAHKTEWGRYEQELAEVQGFEGEVMRDPFGNIYGRLNCKTKGECLKGALQDGWELLEHYQLPEPDEEYHTKLAERLEKNSDKYLIGSLPLEVFSTMRDLRRIDNIMMDCILEEDNVLKLLNMIEESIIKCVNSFAELKFDGVMIYDDWGTQNSLLINPNLWRKLFKPTYAKVIQETHNNGMKFFMHSCGYIYDIIDDLIEIGVDVLQLDQADLIGVKKLGEDFAGKVTFWCPVDIQKIMMTGEKQRIEAGAAKMITHLGGKGGGFIARDYPSWEDIDVKDEWAQWARDIFTVQSYV